MHRFRSWILDPPEYRSQRNRLLPIEGGDGSTLSLNFTTGVLDSRLSFTRSTIGTYIDADGLLKTASINTPRFTYDPTNIGVPLGLLVEGIAANLVVRSSDYSTGWTTSNITVGSSVTAPDGNTSATTLSATATAATSLYQSVGAVSGTAITLSVWVKQGTMATIKLLVYDTTASTTRGETTYTFSTNSFSGTSGGGAPRSVTYKNGWYRLEFPITTHVSGNSLACYFAFGAQTVTAGQTVILWGCQAEAGNGSSSYIPTVASQVTREADFALMSDISSIGFNAASGGTLFAEWCYTKTNTASYPCGVGFMGATDFPTPPFEQFTNTGNIFAAARGDSITSLEKFTAYSLNTFLKFAASFDLTASPKILRINLNGTALSDTDAGTGPLRTPTRFVISRPSYGAFLPCGILKTAKYWPITKTATELASLVV